MLNTHMIARGAAVAAVALVAACSADSATSPTSSMDLGTAVAQAELGDLSSYGWAGFLSGVPTAPEPAFNPSACPFTAADQSFTCTQRTDAGFTFQLKYFLYGSAGQALTQADPAAMSSIRTVVDVHGSPSLPAGSVTASIAVNHHSDMTVSGLNGTRVVNGTSWDRDTLVARRDSVRTVVSVIGTTTNVVLPSGSNKYPASGTIASDITASTQEADRLVQSLLRTVLSFDGTNIATLTLSDGLGSTTCRIDLSGLLPPRCP